MTLSMSSNKWVVLAVYSLSAALSQLLWLNFAPVIPLIESKFSVTEMQASFLILVFPLIYVLIAIPTGAFVDKHGYRLGIGVGTIIMSIFACLRIYDGSFYILLVAQIGIAVAQPFIINGISKLVLDYFPKKQSVIATGLGTVGMFIGMAVGMAATPPMLESLGFPMTMAAFALTTIASSILFFTFVKKDLPGEVPSSAESHFLNLLKDKNLVNLFTLSFLGLGFFNGLTTWLELILQPRGITSSQAGVAGGVLILGGIFGAAIIPALSEHFKKRKPFLTGSILIAALTLYPLCFGHTYIAVLTFSFLQGFFFLPAFSFLLEMCSEIVGENKAASATGLLMMAGNGGGVVVVLAMEWVKSDSQGFTPSVNLLFTLLVISLILSFGLPETRTR
jgi:predicted MFS family arabinose efflux permease